MTQGELVTLIMCGLGVLTFVSGVWWRVEGKVKEAKTEACAAAGAAQATAQLALTQVADLRVHVAENYTSKLHLDGVRAEIMGALRDVKGSVDHMNERVDRAFEART